MNRYDFIADYYDTLLSKLEKKTLRSLRERFVPGIEGKTLDLAAGTGNNIEFYPGASTVTLIDKSEKMLKKAQEKATEDRGDLTLDFVKAPVESLPFDDESFDTVLSIDVFCSVDSSGDALDEVYRVLRTGGKAVFVEHMRTGKPVTDFFLSIVTVFTYLFAGSSMIRPVDDYIRHSQLHVERIVDLENSFKYFLCRK